MAARALALTLVASAALAFSPPGLRPSRFYAPHARARHASTMASWASATTGTCSSGVANANGTDFTVDPIVYGQLKFAHAPRPSCPMLCCHPLSV